MEETLNAPVVVISYGSDLLDSVQQREVIFVSLNTQTEHKYSVVCINTCCSSASSSETIFLKQTGFYFGSLSSFLFWIRKQGIKEVGKGAKQKFALWHHPLICGLLFWGLNFDFWSSPSWFFGAISDHIWKSGLYSCDTRRSWVYWAGSKWVAKLAIAIAD